MANSNVPSNYNIQILPVSYRCPEERAAEVLTQWAM